ncbi:protein of unknown function [Streptomyces sp. KY75]|nr:protein of unknown function [Streptomyces sp. KY70]CAD5980193.1 protein of unknown function [Streptomyces sp. KY75]
MPTPTRRQGARESGPVKPDIADPEAARGPKEPSATAPSSASPTAIDAAFRIRPALPPKCADGPTRVTGPDARTFDRRRDLLRGEDRALVVLDCGEGSAAGGATPRARGPQPARAVRSSVRRRPGCRFRRCGGGGRIVAMRAHRSSGTRSLFTS